MNSTSATNCYLLIASPAESIDGKSIPAEEMVRRRLSAKKWALYPKTCLKSQLQPNDELLFYLAGIGGGRIVASAVLQAFDYSKHCYDGVDGDALVDIPVAVLLLSSIQLFPKPIKLTEIKDNLELIPKGTPKWGCALRGGIRRISIKDREFIIKQSGLFSQTNR